MAALTIIAIKDNHKQIFPPRRPEPNVAGLLFADDLRSIITGTPTLFARINRAGPWAGPPTAAIVPQSLRSIGKFSQQVARDVPLWPTMIGSWDLHSNRRSQVRTQFTVRG